VIPQIDLLNEYFFNNQRRNISTTFFTQKGHTTHHLISKVKLLKQRRESLLLHKQMVQKLHQFIKNRNSCTARNFLSMICVSVL
jgi:hypothetical protein